MDEEYDVIVLGTGLTVSAAPGARSPTSPHPPRSAAAPDPILSLPSAALPTPAGSLVPEKKKNSPVPTPTMSPLPTAVAPSLRNGPRFFCPLYSPGPDSRPLLPSPSQPTPPLDPMLPRASRPIPPHSALYPPEPLALRPDTGPFSIPSHLALILIRMK